jgi:RHS repeat-associated protein
VSFSALLPLNCCVAANNRYYSNAYGRFMTPDPYEESGGPTDPGSWNRYTYTRGDPANRYDPEGLDDCPPGWICQSFNPIPLPPTPLPPPQTGWQWAPPQTGLPFNPQPTSATFNTLCGPITYYAGMTIAPSCLPCPAGQVHNQQGNCVNVATPFSATIPGTNWCGPGGKGPALDAVDALCYLHDACYAAADIKFLNNLFGFLNTPAMLAAMNACDQQLCQILLSLPSSLSSPMPPQEIDQSITISSWFGCVQ